MKGIFSETDYNFENEEERLKAMEKLKKELAENGTIEDLAIVLLAVTKRFGILIREEEK